MSPPVQKNLSPAPVIMRARKFLSDFSRSSFSSKAVVNSELIELPASGLFSIKSSMFFSLSERSMSLSSLYRNYSQISASAKVASQFKL